MLGYSEIAAWKKTPFQIIKLFEYHKEYNPQQFNVQQSTRQLDDIDIALGGL